MKYGGGSSRTTPVNAFYIPGIVNLVDYVESSLG